MLVVLVAEGGSWDVVSVELPVVIHSGPSIPSHGGGYSVLKKKSGGLRCVLGPYIHNGALVKFIKQNKKTYQKLETHMNLEPSPCPHVPIPFHILMLIHMQHFLLHQENVMLLNVT